MSYPVKIVLFFLLLLVASCETPQVILEEKEDRIQKEIEVNASELTKEAIAISDRLETYIKGYFQNKNGSAIPESLIPLGVDFEQNKDFFIEPFENLDASNQWAVREAATVDLQNVKSGIPDPHVTYLLLGTVLAPFGTKVVIEGDYPYARFFSIQVTAPFDGKSFCANRVMGPTEVSLADVDIDPLPGHVNPFLPGADRGATNRKYRVEIDLAHGDPVGLNPDFKPPYRMEDSKVYGAFLQSQGTGYALYNGKGPWNMGGLWIRYYAPDTDKGPTAGVPLPKIHYELPDGTKYFINSDFSGLLKTANLEQPAAETSEIEPTAPIGPGMGWYKNFGILRGSLEGVYQLNGWVTEANMQKVRNEDLRITGRGEFQPAPHHYEPSATGNNYATYIGRGMSLGRQKVAVLTGQLPTFPDTRGGTPVMETAQLRYFSITGYDVSVFRKTLGSAMHSVMDDEIIIDENRKYIIVYSRPEDRPANATAENGVTWVNWGPTSDQSLTFRWLSVGPEWESSPNPHEEELPYATADLAGSRYDETLLGGNTHTGHLGEYLPKVHYLKKLDFEALGASFRYSDIPEWTD
ncbi:hypothetical protein FGM00_01325 [Aggregatimonas sangjinii]|uniref:Uncharacterized protein n=1 Tax=Aggregatimonas sangjinii TaxID=2583587 RepID=A0A5B7SJT0_9FLAO|nr:hypothetical protein [Aggregatimonas sangjinii]QCW98825.1 hypothetical protein FGM00_01325 [Aggregatimonas sangjinii]